MKAILFFIALVSCAPALAVSGSIDLGSGGLPFQLGNSGKYLTTDGTSASWGTVTTGTVTSVNVTLPNTFSVSGGPVTSSGTIAATYANQSANQIFAGPNTGAAAAPSFRALVAADIPDISATYIPYSKKTGPASYSPTFPSNTGISSSTFFWWRDGKWVYIDGQINFSGAGPSGALTFTLPNSYTIDTNFLPGGTNATNPLASALGNGDSFWFQSGVAWKSIWPKYVDTTHVGFWTSTQAFFQDQQSSGSALNFRVRFPATELSN